MRRFICNSADVQKSAFIWNTCASMLNAFQTVFILILISRIDPILDAGIFTIAFAIANLIMTVSRYGIRQFQASDAHEKYSFQTYRNWRAVTTLASIIVLCAYVGYCYGTGNYSYYKSIVVILIGFTKIIDAFEDVLHGMLQQKNHLDIAGKVLAVRMLIYIIAFLILYYIFQNLIITAAGTFVISLLLFLYLNHIALENFSSEKKEQDIKNIFRLGKECFPLFLSSSLVMYIGNAPKYAIDTILNSEEQACFNYIFMPVFVIGLMSQFVYQPIIHKIAIIWNDGRIQELIRIILKQAALILVLTLFAITGGYFLGIPVLSLIYGVNLAGYKNELVILLIAGGMLAFVNFFQMIITVTRYQNWLIWGYSIGSAIFVLLGKYIVNQAGLLGISIFYALIVSGIAVLFAGMTVFIIIRKDQKLRC